MNDEIHNSTLMMTVASGFMAKAGVQGRQMSP